MNNHLLTTQLNQLSKLKPSPKWRRQTLALLSELSDSSVPEPKADKYIDVSNLHFILAFMWKNRFLLSVAFLLATVGAVGAFVLTQFKTQSQQFEYLTGAERDQVFEQMVKNNPIIVSSVDDQPEVTDKFNYSHTRVSWSNGPKFNQCEIVGSAPGTYFGHKDSDSFEDWSFRKDTFHTANKVIVRDKEGRVQSIFYVNTLDPKSEIAYRYEGGEYAVKRVTKLFDLDLDQSGELPEDPIAGEDGVINSVTEYAKFIELFYKQTPTVLKDKQGNIMLEYTYSVNCEGQVGGELVGEGSERATNKFVTIDYLSSDSYQIFKTESYLDQVSPQNLVRTTNYQYDTRISSFEDVKAEFSLPSEIKVKQIAGVDVNDFPEVPTKAENTAKIMGIIKNNHIPILIVADPAYKNIIWEGATGALVDDFYNITDRAFYSNDERGEAAYQDTLKFSNSGQPTSLIHLSSHPKVGQGFADMKDITELDFFNADFVDPFIDEDTQKFINKWDVNKNISGKELVFTITKYEVETENPSAPNYQGGVPEEAEIYNCIEATCKMGMFYLEVKFANGNLEMINPVYSEQSIMKYINSNLKLLDVDNGQDYIQIKNIVQDSYMGGA